MKGFSPDGCEIATRGRVEWIGVRPAYRAAVEAIASVELVAERGAVGDHAGERPNGKRQVTLVQQEYFALIARFAGVDTIEYATLRRNLVVSGINLNALKRRRFRIGERAILEVTGDCHPCSRMEQVIGRGGFSATRGHGGVTAIVHVGGLVRVGDVVMVGEMA